MTQGMTIGIAAREAGVSVETFRFYQRRGLIGSPDRPFGSFRRYSSDIVKRIRFIKRAQSLGFSLAEIARLLGLEPVHACGETRDLALGKLAVLERKLFELEAMRKRLVILVAECDPEQPGKECPLIKRLAQDEWESSRSSPVRCGIAET
jgi:MerR family mercuric resistance operon transcriptional regulator